MPFLQLFQHVLQLETALGGVLWHGQEEYIPIRKYQTVTANDCTDDLTDLRIVRLFN